jgi:hypothetical protein
MAEIDDVLAELRHRIMGQFESGPPKPARPQLQETNEEGATTHSVNVEYQRHGSAAVALRRLAHPGRDGGAVVEELVSEPIDPERGGGAVVEDELSELFKRLSRDMPELMEEVVAFIEDRTAEMNGDDGAAPRPTESVAPAALVRTTRTLQDDDTGTATISLRFDTQMLARVDADAKRLGISRTAWLHVAADERLEGRR